MASYTDLYKKYDWHVKLIHKYNLCDIYGYLSTTTTTYLLISFFPFLNPYFFLFKMAYSKMSQLPVDCLNEIFEYLENEKVTLLSCLLVNHLWCEISVRILWKNFRNYYPLNFRTLIACLPNESKEILRNNEIIISA